MGEDERGAGDVADLLAVICRRYASGRCDAFRHMSADARAIMAGVSEGGQRRGGPAHCELGREPCRAGLWRRRR
jgi:hypothetical protein